MRRILIGVLAGVYLCSATGVSAATTRVRPVSDRSARLIEVARNVSPTITEMLEQIERSDIILQVEVLLAFDVPFAVTRLVTAVGDVRYVRVSINSRLPPLRKIELLGHELQHVLEIAADPGVRDQNGMAAHFERIGRRNDVTGAYDTDAAMRIESVIRAEAGASGSGSLGRLLR